MKKLFISLLVGIIMLSCFVVPCFADYPSVADPNSSYYTVTTYTVTVQYETEYFFEVPLDPSVLYSTFTLDNTYCYGYGDMLFDYGGCEYFNVEGTEEIYIPFTAWGVSLWLYTDGDDQECNITVTTYYAKSYDDGYAEGYDMGQERYRSELAWLLYANGYKQGYYELANNPTEAYRVLEELIYMQLGSDDWYKGYDEGYKKGLTEGTFSSVSDAYNDLSDKILEGITQTHKDMQNSIDDSANGSFIQGFLAGMWNGMTNLMQMILTGVTFSDLSLMNILATAIAILTAVFVIKMVKG